MRSWLCDYDALLRGSRSIFVPYKGYVNPVYEFSNTTDTIMLALCPAMDNISIFLLMLVLNSCTVCHSTAVFNASLIRLVQEENWSTLVDDQAPSPIIDTNRETRILIAR